MPEEEIVKSTRKRREILKDPRFGQEVKYNGLEPKETAKQAAPEQEISKKTTPSKGKTKKSSQKATGKAVPVKSKEEKEKEAKKKKDLELSKERVKKLNECATFMLNCLEPGFREDWREAAKEQRIPDIGMYVLGVLNRLSKMVDYMEYDIEPEWEQGFVGYNEKLFCEFCTKEIPITKTTHLRQRFCDNLCAKRYDEMHNTGIVFPAEKPGPSEDEIDQAKWQQEAKREGVLTVNG